MSARQYHVRYVHKIAPRSDDRGPDVILSEGDCKNASTLASALRKQKALASGGRVNQFRRDGDGVITAFPSVPGRTTYWHAIICAPFGAPVERAPAKKRGK